MQPMAFHSIRFNHQERIRKRQQNINTAGMRTARQIIEEELSKQKVIDNSKHEEASEAIVPESGPFYENQVIPDTPEEGSRELSEKKAEDINEKKAEDINEKKAEQQHKSRAVDDFRGI